MKKDNILVDGHVFDVPDLDDEKDIDFFGEKVSVKDWVDKNCRKQDGWIEVERSSKSALMLDTKNMRAVRVMSAGTTDFKKYEDKDHHKVVAWLQKTESQATSFTYGPSVLIDKHGKPVKKGKEQTFELPKARRSVNNGMFSNTSVFCEKEEEERAMSNVCPKCFMLKANGHCDCDFD